MKMGNLGRAPMSQTHPPMPTGDPMRATMRFLLQNKGTFAFLLGMVMFRSAVADWNDVPTGSMQPTIRIGDRILIDHLAYDLRVPLTHVSLLHLGDPRRGDIVVLDSQAAGERLVKRVIGVPGDMVALRDNRLFVNGREARYTPVAVNGIADDHGDPARYEIESLGSMRHLVRWSIGSPSPRASFGPVRVPPGDYLLLGDNRDNSEDSRWLGFFPRDEIIGRSTRVVASLDPDRHHLPRMDRFGAKLE